MNHRLYFVGIVKANLKASVDVPHVSLTVNPMLLLYDERSKPVLRRRDGYRNWMIR